jgi:cytochrome c oxidase subunit 2
MNGNGTLQLPPQASTVAPDIDALYYFIFWGCAFFFLLIVGFSLFFIFKYRRREGQTLPERPHHNTRLEVTWTVIPTILVMIVFVWGFRGYMTLSVAPRHAIEYYVTGKTWLWEIKHPNGQVAINEMTVPVNKPVKVILKSDDLLHSFYIPAFRVKQDAVPNRYQTLWFEATIPGDYDIFCTEYCGSGHSQMRATVHVLDDAAWQEWEKKAGGKPEDMPLEVWGGQLYTSKACVTCHTVDGSVLTGPSFKGLFGTEERLADGSTITVDEEYIRKSIVDPAAQVTAGFQPVMPTYSGLLEPEDIDALIAFIKAQE